MLLRCQGSSQFSFKRYAMLTWSYSFSFIFFWEVMEPVELTLPEFSIYVFSRTWQNMLRLHSLDFMWIFQKSSSSRGDFTILQLSTLSHCLTGRWQICGVFECHFTVSICFKWQNLTVFEVHSSLPFLFFPLQLKREVYYSSSCYNTLKTTSSSWNNSLLF